MNILEGLNKEQLKAVETVDGPLLIVAGPGTGKTRVITHRIAYLVNQFGVKPHRIAAMTFTNKAAREMRERLQALMGPISNNLTIGTFHSVCANILRRDGHHIGLDRGFLIYDSDDQLKLIKGCMEEHEIDPRKFAPRAIQSHISAAKSSLIDAEGYAIHAQSYLEEVISRIYKRYQELIRRNKALDFDDLLLSTYQMFNTNEALLKKYQTRYIHILVDEFQDTNIPQYRIAQQLADQYKNICVVGDPDQSIYSWRNADIRNILNFKKDYPEAQIITLEENYRSTETILSAAQSVISKNQERVDKELWTTNTKGSLIKITEEHDEEEEAQSVIREVERLVDTDGYNRSEIAIMYRVNAQSRALEEACLRYGVPYQIIGGVKFYQRREVKDIIAYLRLLMNPHEDVSLTRIINIPNRGIGQRTLDELIQYGRTNEISIFSVIQGIIKQDNNMPSLPARSIRAITDFLNLIRLLSKESQELDIVETIDKILEHTGYQHFAQKDERGEERWENILEFRGLAQEFKNMGPEEGLITFLESVSLSTDLDTMEDEAGSLTLITLHQAKGLEFSAVFIVGIEDGLLPHLRSMNDPGQLEEERRLFYVGITRAKSRLYLYRAFHRRIMGGNGQNDASRFLDDIPRNLIAGLPVISTRQRLITPKNDSLKTIKQPIRLVSDSKSKIRIGDKISHPKFGVGIIVNRVATDQDIELTVAFDKNKGIKRLLASYAPIEKLES